MQQASAASSCSASWPSRYLTCQMYMFSTCLNVPADANHFMYRVNPPAILVGQIV